MENNLEKVIEENQISTDEALAKRKMFLRKQSRLSGQFNSCWGILDNFSKNWVTGSEGDLGIYGKLFTREFSLISGHS